MASRMKRIFSRKKHDSPSPSPEPEVARGNPAFRSSLYDTTTAGIEPQTGIYPMRGQDESDTPQKAKSRRSSFRSRRSSGSQHRPPHRSVTPDQYRAQRSMDISPPPPTSDIANADMYPQQPQSSSTPKKRWSRSNLPEAFSNLDIGNGGAPPAAQANNTFPVPGRSSPATQGAGRSPIAGSSIRPVTGATSGHVSSAPPKSPRSRSRPNSQVLEAHNGQPEYEENARSDRAIPRKQVGPTSAVPSYPATQSSLPKPRKSVNPVSNNGYDSRPSRTADGGAWPMTSDSHSGQATVERAKTNSVQTHVDERIAPAVTHEVVHRKIHHVREEQITREIHEHDTYHRILPIIDVEVLPARHFLPVEGGGLVEVPAREVPGRGNNWVIAETASKIASNQPAPTGRREFSARAFPGREGDALTYITPEGYKKTEQTWVHPPELETGARDTGQSWPMPMGEGMPKKTAPSHKKRSSRKSLDRQKTPLETGAAP